MKKLWISIGMALGLLAAPAIATAQDGARTPVDKYSISSAVKTFTDLKTLTPNETENGVKYKFELGAGLADAANLDDIFYVSNNDATSAEATSFKEVTMTEGAAVDAEERTQKAIPLSVLGLTDFDFLGKPVKGFAVAAAGGILFAGDDMTVSCQGGTPENAQISGAVYKDFARVYACDDNWENTTASKSANAPVIIAGGTDATQGAFIWAQFNLTFGDMNWLFQIRCYANGKTEYILGNDLEHSQTQEYYFCPALVQDGDVDGGVITLGTGGYANDAHCWDALQRNPSVNTVDSDCILLDADCGPEVGRTITLVPPVNAAAFSMADPTMTANTLNGTLRLDPAQAPAIALSEGIHTLCITMTTAANQSDSKDGLPPMEAPTTAIKTNKNQVVYVGKPTDLSQAFEMPLAVSQLQPNTEYYIHVVPCFYTPGAAIPYRYAEFYSNQSKNPLISFGPYKTSAAVTDISVAIADGYAQLTFQPATGYSTMLVKSDKPTAPAVSGKLQQGDGLGTNGADGTVIGVWDATTTSYNLPLKAGEGCYLHFYCVENAGTDNAIYGEAVSTTAYRPAETLPFTWSFNANQVVPTPTALPLLPPGWQHGANSKVESDLYFCVGATSTFHGLKLYNKIDAEVSVLSPAFITDTSLVSVTLLSFFDWNYTLSGSAWIRIEYRENDGEWAIAKTFTGADLPAADENGLLPFNTNITCTRGARIEMRYTANLPSYYTNFYIVSVKVEGANPCLAPTNLTIAADATTDQAVKLSWDAIAEATAFTVAYQEAGTTTPGEWTEKPATEKEMTLDGLNSRTAYRIKVSAACTFDSKDLTSPFTSPITATTYAGAPYHESMDNVYEDPEDWLSDLLSSPADRGVKTYTGKIDGALSENTGASYTWASGNTVSAINSKPETAMGVKDDMDEGSVLLTPVIYVDREDLYLNVTLTSFSATQNPETYRYEIVEEGNVAPNADCKLHIAVSNTGSFTTTDIVKTLTGDELKLDETVVKIPLEKKGKLQIGLFFDNPTPNYRDDPHFYLEVSELKLAPEGKFTLTAAAEPAEGGTVTGGGEYAATAEVTLRAIANNGYDFVAWKNGETELSTSAIYTFEMPGENVTYTAHFAPHEYNLNLTASPAAGGTVEGAKKYPMGADVTIKATPAQGYVFVAWMNGETEVSKAAEYTFKMPASDLSYTAKFEKPTYELTLAPSSPRAGSVEGAGSYEADADVTIKATANEGYTFVAWMNGETEVSKEAEYTFKMPAQNTHYMALFQADKQEFTLTLNVSPAEAGTVEGAGKHEAGTDVTIKATANEGYEFVAWMNGETEVSKEAEYTFKMPAENVTYTATFAKKSANEDVLRANFNLYAKDGRLHIRNLEGMTISSVEAYSLNGQRLNTFTPNSREDLSLAVAAERALVFVRIHTDRGAAIYKIYLP